MVRLLVGLLIRLLVLLLVLDISPGRPPGRASSYASGLIVRRVRRDSTVLSPGGRGRSDKRRDYLHGD